MIYTTYHVLCILIYCCFSFLAEYQTQGRNTVHIDVLIVWLLEETRWLADFVLNLASDFVWFHRSVCLTLAQFYCRWCWEEALTLLKSFCWYFKIVWYQIFSLISSLVPLFTWFAASLKSKNSTVAFCPSVRWPQKWCHNYYCKIPFSSSVLFIFLPRTCKHC